MRTPIYGVLISTDGQGPFFLAATSFIQLRPYRRIDSNLVPYADFDATDFPECGLLHLTSLLLFIIEPNSTARIPP